jgi:hypothetical protein
MAEKPSADLGEPPSVAALSMAETATTHVTEQQIDPWSVKAATDEQGNALAFDYEAISQYVFFSPVPRNLRLPFIVASHASIIHSNHIYINLMLHIQEMEHQTHRQGPARAFRARNRPPPAPLATARSLLLPPRLQPHSRLLRVGEGLFLIYGPWAKCWEPTYWALDTFCMLLCCCLNVRAGLTAIGIHVGVILLVGVLEPPI